MIATNYLKFLYSVTLIMIKITIYFTDMDPLLTPNSNKTVYLDALYEYNLISFIKYLLSLKEHKENQ